MKNKGNEIIAFGTVEYVNREIDYLSLIKEIMRLCGRPRKMVDKEEMDKKKSRLSALIKGKMELMKWRKENKSNENN